MTTTKGPTTIFSIFGQIEEVVARAMANEGKGHIIPTEQFPPEKECPDVWTGPDGRRAKCALCLSRGKVVEFDRRVAELYA